MQNEELQTPQAETEESRTRTFDLFDLASVGYCSISEKGLILEANLTTATLLDTTRSALVKQPFVRFILKEDQDIYSLHLKQIFETREPQECDLRLVKPDGAVLWVHLAGIVAQGEDRSPVSRMVISDLTGRKQTEEELAQTHVLLRETILQSPQGMALMSTKDSRFKIINKAAEDFLMIHAVDYVGKNPDEMEITWQEYAPDGRKLELDELPTARGLQGLPTHGFEHRTVRRDGSELWALSSGAPIYDSQGNQIAVLLVMQNITERNLAEEENRKLESQLQQAQKMESIGRLAGGVAHDFNNMLGVILGHADMIRENMAPAQPFHADLTEIMKAGERATDLTRQLLAFARKQTVAPKVLDLNETVENMTKMLHRLIGDNIDMVWIPGEKVWPVKIDPSQIDQILTNLCVNARDAIAGVGKVTIETGNAVIGEDDTKDHLRVVPGEYAMLAVRDSGCGMDSETLSQIFEPFFTTKPMGKGTGLGLATVYGIVKQNSGFINVHSEPGQGTIFELYLPRHMSQDERRGVTRAPASVVTGHETILVVEDEPMILDMTAAILTHLGYTVLAAKTPGKALEIAREHAGELHLLLTDVVMPQMNGKELAEELSVLYPDLRTLFMSGYTANVIAHHGVLDDGVFFLQKPFRPSTLAAKVRETLGQG